MPDLTFDMSPPWEHGECADPLEAATYGSLALRVGELQITEVQDHAARTTRDTVRVSAYPLALWLVSAWWRLRWEGRRDGTDWRLSHQIGGAGGGYVWPDLTFVSDGEWIQVEVRRRPRSAWEPISYLNSGVERIAATDFEEAVRRFVEGVLRRLGEMGHRSSPLSELWESVQSERRDADSAASRRLEAILGFDAEEAPTDLLDAYLSGGREFGTAAVAELAALATNGALPNWRHVSDALRSGASIHIGRHERLRAGALHAVERLPVHSQPWERGEAAARAVREELGMRQGPLSNDALREWLGEVPTSEPLVSMAAIARRERPDAPDLKVCYRSSHPNGRRFELARLLGDHLIASSVEDRWLPATRARTARQSVQRAFAAELLLPWEDLTARIQDATDSEAIETTAGEFEVSPLVVTTRLVTKGVLSSDALDVD